MRTRTLIRQLKSADFPPICEHNGFPPYLHNITDHHCRVGDTVPILIAVLWGMLCCDLSWAALKRGNHLSLCKPYCCSKIYFPALIIYRVDWWLYLETCCLFFFFFFSNIFKNTASEETASVRDILGQKISPWLLSRPAHIPEYNWITRANIRIIYIY